MKKIIISLLLTFLFSIHSYSQNGIKNTGVSIFSLGYGIGNCSGVIIEETDTYTSVLSCRHCIGATEEVYVENNKVKLIITLPDEDLALIIVEGKIKDKIKTKISNNNPKIGDKITLIGYPNFELYQKTGKIIKVTKDWYWAKLECKGGCSGGGIFNEDYELIGILWGGLDSVGWSIFEPLQDIKRFLEKIEEWK